MRRLILVGVLGLALPAFAADDAVPAIEAATPEAVAPTAEPGPTADEGATATEPEVASAEPVRPPVPPDAVARRTFTTAVEQHEPVDSITSLESDRDRVYYFTEFVGVDGRRLTHRWEYQGEVVAEVPITIGGPRWRAYSSKSLGASRLGEWTVSIVDESGHVVHTDSFVYEAARPASGPWSGNALATPSSSDHGARQRAAAIHNAGVLPTRIPLSPSA